MLSKTCITSPLNTNKYWKSKAAQHKSNEKVYSDNRVSDWGLKVIDEAQKFGSMTEMSNLFCIRKVVYTPPFKYCQVGKFIDEKFGRKVIESKLDFHFDKVPGSFEEYLNYGNMIFRIWSLSYNWRIPVSAHDRWQLHRIMYTI